MIAIVNFHFIIPALKHVNDFLKPGAGDLMNSPDSGDTDSGDHTDSGDLDLPQR